MRAFVLVMMLGGCGFSVTPAGTSPSDGAPGDGSTDAPGEDARVDGPPGAACYGTSLVRVCYPSAPTGTRSLSGNFNTDDDGMCTSIEMQVGGPSLCTIAAGSLEITGSLIATGQRPLVLVAETAITISGVIDVSSRTTGGRCGAGCNFAQCSVAGAGTPDGGGGGGGAGGSFGTIGGTGGLGDLNMNQPPAGSAPGGMPGATAVPTTLRGGCRGGNGGAGGGVSDTGGQGGSGGGAVYLIAGTTITIDGAVYASGAGGTIASGNAGYQDGGGGGGSGGMIGLDAPALVINGRVVANGAGGAGGGGNTGGGPGGDGTTTDWNTAAIGGTAGPTVAGPGGTGTAIGQTSGISAPSADAGGGGGGGGLGVVWIDGGVTGGAMISPAPTPH